jgi:DNA-binding CsgD family transcriptional regulator
VVLEYQAGRFDEGARFLERLLASANTAPNWPIFDHAAVAVTIPAIARITGVPDRFDLAKKSAQSYLSSPMALPRHSMTAQTGLALMAVALGDRTACEKSYAEVLSTEKFYDSPLTEGRLLGLLAHGMGNLDKAVEHFEDALGFCRPSGRLPELAWTCLDYAHTLLSRNGAGDREKAKSMLGESLSIATDLGMPPLIAQVVALQERAESRPGKAPAFPDGLSLREVEVLRLIAAGKTDREIADELFISPRTVGHHVGNILNKTNTANRAEASTYAAMNGLTAISEPDS